MQASLDSEVTTVSDIKWITFLPVLLTYEISNSSSIWQWFRFMLYVVENTAGEHTGRYIEPDQGDV